MKRSLCFLLVSFAFVAHASAQSLSLKVGTVVVNHGGVMNNQRIEALVAYPLLGKLDVTLATGYDRYHVDASRVIVPDVFVDGSGSTAVISWGATYYPAITHHFIPIVAGVKYSLVKHMFSPYLTAEVGKYFDLAGHSAFNVPRGARGGDDDSSGTLFKIGGGVHYHASENLGLDLSVRGLHESNAPETVEVMAGIVLPL